MRHCRFIPERFFVDAIFYRAETLSSTNRPPWGYGATADSLVTCLFTAALAFGLKPFGLARFVFESVFVYIRLLAEVESTNREKRYGD